MSFIRKQGCHYHYNECAVTNHKWILLSFLTTILLLSQTITAQTVIIIEQEQEQQEQQVQYNNNNEVSRNNLDLFNYKGSISAIDNNGIPEYGPNDWEKIKCPNPDICAGFPAKFANSQGWHINSTNFCQSCPDGDSDCGFHHQSPIPLSRTVSLEYANDYYMCADGHWMAYFDSSCSFNELKQKDAFIIDRYALRIIQPIIDNENDGSYTIDCKDNNNIQKWGRIDFANGFPDWWLLSHIDFHVPSEHTQQGKRYSGEIQMYHFYSVAANEAGVNNEMATVTVFIEEYDDADDWDELNKVICAWREAEEKNREACGIRSVETVYDGCTIYTRSGTSVSFDGTSDSATDGSTSSLDDILKQRLNQSDPDYYNYTIVAPNGTSFAANIIETSSDASIYDKLNQRKSPTSSPTYINVPITSTPTTLLPVPIGTYMPSKGPTVFSPSNMPSQTPNTLPSVPSSILRPVPSIPTILPPVIPTTLSSDTPTVVGSDISTDGIPNRTPTSWTNLPSSIPISTSFNTPAKSPSVDTPNVPTIPTSSSSTTDSIPMASPTRIRKPTRSPRVPSSTQSIVTPVTASNVIQLQHTPSSNNNKPINIVPQQVVMYPTRKSPTLYNVSHNGETNHSNSWTKSSTSSNYSAATVIQVSNVKSNDTNWMSTYMTWSKNLSNETVTSTTSSLSTNSTSEGDNEATTSNYSAAGDIQGSNIKPNETNWMNTYMEWSKNLSNETVTLTTSSLSTNNTSEGDNEATTSDYSAAGDIQGSNMKSNETNWMSNYMKWSNNTSEGDNEGFNHTGKNDTTWTSSNTSGTKNWTSSTVSWNRTDTISNRKAKETTQDDGNRKLRSVVQKSNDANVENHYKPAASIYDILHENHYHLSQNTIDFEPRTIKGDEHHYDTQDDFDWDGFISNEYRKLEEKKHDSRRLNDYQHVEWFNYFPMAGVKTEYYHRYSGTQTIPPCYGTWVRDSRKQTNHWRVMKDPVRVSPRQIQELHRLLRERIAPSTDPISACKADTAAAPDPYDSSKVNVARPLQQKSQPHFQSFCECNNWHSQWREDIAWCRNHTLSERIYDNPYNFKTDGY